jgi:hypothetical protein
MTNGMVAGFKYHRVEATHGHWRFHLESAGNVVQWGGFRVYKVVLEISRRIFPERQKFFFGRVLAFWHSATLDAPDFQNTRNPIEYDPTPPARPSSSLTSAPNRITISYII